MSIDILMPALSPTMEEGKLSKWLKKEGDKVSSGDIIAEIETDKAMMEVEAVDEGTLGRICVLEGSEGVKVNTVIAVLLEEGETVEDISQSTNSLNTHQKNGVHLLLFLHQCHNFLFWILFLILIYQRGQRWLR